MKANPLIDLLFPPRCAFCGRVGVHGICKRCDQSLPWLTNSLRVGAGFGSCAAPLPYEGAVREALLRFKFRGGQDAAEGLGLLTARCAAEHFAGDFELVTWVPVSEQRKKQRGYDQAYLIAREAARLWDAEPLPLLKKIRDNPAQSGLSAEQRKANVLGVYEARNRERFAGKRVLIIDDIITTGATLSECARVLRDAGAERVLCVCAASAGVEYHKNEPVSKP